MVTAILEAKNLIKLELEQLIGSLIALKMINSDDRKKKKYLALKASHLDNDDDDINDEEILSSFKNSHYFPSEGERDKNAKTQKCFHWHNEIL